MKSGIKNLTDETIPSYSICIVKKMLSMESRAGFEVEKPSDSNLDAPIFVFTQQSTVSPSSSDTPYGTGMINEYPIQVRYDSADAPAIGDTVGPIDDEWHVSKDGDGLIVVDLDPVIDQTLYGFKTCWVMPGAGSGKRYFRLAEDMSGTSALAFISDRDDTKASEKPFRLHNWDGLLTGAMAGYHGQASLISGSWDFTQGPCVVKCTSGGTIISGGPLTGKVNTAFTPHTIISSGLDANSLSVGALPAGLGFSQTTSQITGTPTKDGVFYVVITGTAPKTGPAPVAAGSRCTISRLLKITIEAA